MMTRTQPRNDQRAERIPSPEEIRGIRRVIGIDPGTQCGWAVLSNDGQRIASGVWNLSPGRFEGSGMRFFRLGTYFETLIAGTQSETLVAYEEVRRHLGTDAAHIYGGVIATITRLCETYAIPYKGIPVGTIKKTATGKGNANKEAMMKAAEAHWGQWCAEDESDALFCAETLRRELSA